MKAFQCSRCAQLKDLDETCTCQIGIDPRPTSREKGDVELCRANFEAIAKHWHEKFSWE